MTNNEINNFEEFNNKENLEEIKEIKIKFKKFQEQQLVIKNYSKLEKLQLLKINNINKINLENLTQLQECTIQGCGTIELVIENCPQIKTLNVKNNSLTSLGFLKDLGSLKELEIDGNDKIESGLNYLPSSLGKFSYENTGLTGLLEPNWETCQKERQELFAMTQQNSQQLVKDFWDLSKRHKHYKKIASTLLKGGAVSLNTVSKEIKTSLLFSNLEKEFKEKEERINNLELQVRELAELSDKQRQSIQSHLESFGSEEQKLIKELIIEYLIFIKLKKEETDTEEYYERRQKSEECYQNVKRELKNKLGKKVMFKVDRILDDCEKLFEREQEIEKKLGDRKTLLVEGKQEILSQVTDSNEKDKIIHELEIKLAKTEGQLEVYQKTPMIQKIVNISDSQQVSVGDNTTFNNYRIQYNIQQSQRELEELKQNYQTLAPINEPTTNPHKLKKFVLFLGAKQIFVTTRKDTIEQLVIVSQKLGKSDERYNVIVNASNYLSNIRELVSIFPGGGIAVDVVSKGVPAIANLLKNRSFGEYKQEFENYLIKDEKAVYLLEKTYLTLNNSLQDGEKSDINPFIRKMLNLDIGKFDQYNVFVVSKLQKGEELTPEKMKLALDLLTNDLEKFVRDSQQEVQQNVEEMGKLFQKEGNEHLQDEVIVLLEKLSGRESQSEQFLIEQTSLENQVEAKEVDLQRLIVDAKNKLKSRFPFFTSKREAKLNSLLDIQAEIFCLGCNTKRQNKLISLKNELLKIAGWHGHKEFKTELDNLCQIKIELTRLKMKLGISQQAQVEISAI